MADQLQKEKLLYVINHIDWFWSHRLPLALGAQNEGWDVHVAVPEATADTKLEDNNFVPLDLPHSSLKTLLALRKMLRRTRPDVVHAITIKYAFFTGLAALFIKDVRLVHTIAGLGYLFSGTGFKPKLLRFILGPFLRLAFRRKNTSLIFQNPDDMAIFLKRGFAHEEQCHLILGSGVDTDIFAPQDEKTSEEDLPIVVMPTRLVHDKGVAIFIEAANLLKEKGVQAKMQIAGGITDNNPLAISKDEMDDMIKGKPVEWLGRVRDMPALLQSASLIAYPSYYREGIPKVLLEAASMAKPIITTDHPGCREVVEPDVNGYLIPVKDTHALAESIEDLLKDKTTLKKMGEASRKLALEKFDVRLIVEQTLHVYKAS